MAFGINKYFENRQGSTCNIEKNYTIWVLGVGESHYLFFPLLQIF